MGYERNDRGYGRDANRFDAYRETNRYDANRHDREDPRDRGFFDRAGDEVRSWFGDEEAERRRRYDEQYDERYDRSRYGDEAGRDQGYQYALHPNAFHPRYDRSNRPDTLRGGSAGGYRGGYGHAAQDRSYGSYRDEGRNGYGGDRDWRKSEYRALYGGGSGNAGVSRYERHDDPHGYHNWRDQQVSAFDRDYDEYRRENQSRFASEFSAWRENRQGQRNSLRQAREHQEVLGSDGAHVGTVDHIRGDRILLTKTDKDAGGHHHSIPSSWIQSVDDKVHLSKTAEQAQQAWRDEETNRGLFGNRDRDDQHDRGAADLNRSFSGTY